ncbi:MAG: hypothetical protein AAGG75_20105, partial [Bacteroidota bacterium]
MRYLILLCSLLLAYSCTHKSENAEIAKYADQFHHDEFLLKGDYHWAFQLMGGTQQSVHHFYPDSITYSMEGRVYSTDYTMQKLSYDQSNNKWIGHDGNGVVYVLFFKDKTEHSITIYKRKCKTAGIKEAIEFGVPKADATEDHGWNVYAYNIPDQKDVLAVHGTYWNNDHTLSITDSLVVLNDKSFAKLSYHKGERRWVGKNDSTYLQIFFQDLADHEEMYFAVGKHQDLEKM